MLLSVRRRPDLPLFFSRVLFLVCPINPHTRTVRADAELVF